MSKEIIKNVPDEWMVLLNKMPDLKEYFIEQAEYYDDCFEGVPESFFTGCYELYFESYKEYEPFFTCFERGKEVFENFYEAWGSSEDICNECDEQEWEKIKQEHKKAKAELISDETKLKEIAKRYIDGINYILSLDDEEGYDFEQMNVRILKWEEFKEEYDTDEMQDIYDELKDKIADIVDDEVFPDYEDNFLLTIGIDALPDISVNNVYLDDYILWPIAKIDDVENPFRPYYELWEYGIDIYVTDDEIIMKY